MADMVSPGSGSRSTSRTESAFRDPTITSGLGWLGLELASQVIVCRWLAFRPQVRVLLRVMHMGGETMVELARDAQRWLGRHNMEQWILEALVSRAGSREMRDCRMPCVQFVSMCFVFLGKLTEFPAQVHLRARLLKVPGVSRVGSQHSS